MEQISFRYLVKVDQLPAENNKIVGDCILNWKEYPLLSSYVKIKKI